MNILKDMELFVKIVHCDGLAAAGRELGLTPSSVSMRIKNLEKYFQVKLLTRTTRSINLTDNGREFYEDSLRMLEEITQIENKFKSSQDSVSGPLRITVASDLGRQHIAPLLNEFITAHPEVNPFLNLSDSVTDMTESNIDIAIRYGISPDSQLIAKKIAKSHRVLCASPEYLQRYGTPECYTELVDHLCLTMVHARTPKSKWYFDTEEGEKSVVVQSSRSCDDGAQIRQWAIQGAGIALKAYWDVADDLGSGRLVTLLDRFNPDYQSKAHSIGSDLYVAYQDRKYVPSRTREFIKALNTYFSEYLKREASR